MPPGPVGVTAMKLGLNKGMRPAVYMSVGSGLFDVVFCLVAIFAASAAVDSLSSFSDKHPILMITFQILIVLGFIVYGYFNLKKSKNSETGEVSIENDTDIAKSSIVSLLKEKGPFFLGVGIALTNIANPTFLPSLAYIGMQVKHFELFPDTSFNNIIFSIGFGLGNFLWLWLLTYVVIRLKDRFSGNFIFRVRQFAGITFISFGGILGWRLLTLTKWSEIIRLAFAF